MSQNQEYPQMGVAMTCRSFQEYMDMFALDESHLQQGKIVDVAGGASSFIAEASTRGYNTVAADPQYALSPKHIEQAGRQEIENSTAKLAAIAHVFNWSYYHNLDNHRKLREKSLQMFADHYARPENRGHYVSAVLPTLPFADDSFGLVVCSHFLFLYHDQFDYDFHRNALLELARVCRPGGQIRLYPIVSLKWEPYPHLEQLLQVLQSKGMKTKFIPTKLPFAPNSMQVLCLEKV